VIRLSRSGDYVSFWVRVKANARICGFKGEQNGSLKIGVREAPEKGKANRALIKLLAESLGVSRRDIRILRGLTSRDKLIEVIDSTGEIERRLRLAGGKKGGKCGEPLGKD